MAIKKCAQNHFYDGEKFSECPHCKNDLPAQSRRGIFDAQTLFGASVPDSANDVVRQKVHVEMGPAKGNTHDAKTVGIFRSEKGYDPVVGWLVCVKGNEKGRDFRLHVGRNYIGRSLKSDIALVDDSRISRDDHCSVVYEPNTQSFHLVRGFGEEICINGERLAEPHLLATDDTIQLGDSTLVFIPFCKGVYLW